MEGYVFKWVNFIKGWKPRYMVLDQECLYYSKNKNEQPKKKKMNLGDLKITDEKKKKHFLIEFQEKKIYIKTNTDDEKKAWIAKFLENINNLTKSKRSRETNQVIPNKPSSKSFINSNIFDIKNKILKEKEITENEIKLEQVERRKSKIENLSLTQTGSYEIEKDDQKVVQPIDDYLHKENNLYPVKNKKFSESYKAYYAEINKNKNETKTKFDSVIINFQNFQNLLFEFNSAMENFNLLLMSSKIKSKEKEEFMKTYANLFNIKHEMKEHIEESIKNLIEYNEETQGKGKLSKINEVDECREIQPSPIENDHKIFKNNSEIFYCAEDEYANTYKESEFFDDVKSRIIPSSETKKLLNLYSKSNEIKNLPPELCCKNEKVISKFIPQHYIETENIDNDVENYLSNSNESSFEECASFKENNQNLPEGEFKECLEKSILLESNENKIKFSRSLSFMQSDFYDILYHFPKRKDLQKTIKCSSSMVSDMIKSLAKDKIQLPIHYNEPISMLQKQCEKFQFSDLLAFAAKETSLSMKLSYIASFIVSELSLNINRILKPFNPILGETFEYFDNDLKYRYFSEQVSHNPPISAFICESEEYVVYGDTRCKNKFKFLKGAMEINFTNKTNILFKNSNEHFTYEKPTVYLKGLIYGTPHFDFSGVITIQDINNKGNKLVLDFFEEGRKSKPLGYFEGKIYISDLLVNCVTGNWTKGLWMTDKDNNPKSQNEIFKIEEQPFMVNTDLTKNYLIPSYACNLNYLPTECELSNQLPPTDSRLRPDQRALEDRDMENAEKEKTRIENNQRLRHKKFEEEKIKYEPNYFVEVLEDKTNDYVYIYKGDYWGDRKNKNFSHLHNIFS
jgi:hypothetical protein